MPYQITLLQSFIPLVLRFLRFAPEVIHIQLFQSLAFKSATCMAERKVTTLSKCGLQVSYMCGLRIKETTYLEYGLPYRWTISEKIK